MDSYPSTAQYCNAAFRSRLSRYGFVQSLSRKGNCRDTARAESFFQTLKSELWGHQRTAKLEMARMVIFESLEVIYNSQRLHSGFGYMAPIENAASVGLRSGTMRRVGGSPSRTTSTLVHRAVLRGEVYR